MLSYHNAQQNATVQDVSFQFGAWYMAQNDDYERKTALSDICGLCRYMFGLLGENKSNRGGKCQGNNHSVIHTRATTGPAASTYREGE